MKGLEGGQVCRFDGKIQSCVVGVGVFSLGQNAS